MKIELESYEIVIKKIFLNGVEREVAQLRYGFNEDFIKSLRERGVKDYIPEEREEILNTEIK